MAYTRHASQKGTPLKSLMYRVEPRLKETFKWLPLSASRVTPRPTSSTLFNTLFLTYT